jgi:hypothetical protein
MSKFIPSLIVTLLVSSPSYGLDISGKITVLGECQATYAQLVMISNLTAGLLTMSNTPSDQVLGFARIGQHALDGFDQADAEAERIIGNASPKDRIRLDVINNQTFQETTKTWEELKVSLTTGASTATMFMKNLVEKSNQCDGILSQID